ncbi:MAG: MFS transporter [Deltaproteobacteria bacterium]|jgi:predicted MFS family arabinose efflux permease|nr:MFS transporter [Deltaproteobacteria bacterium]
MRITFHKLLRAQGALCFYFNKTVVSSAGIQMTVIDKIAVEPVEQALASARPGRAVAGSRIGVLTALFVAGFSTFITLYTTQPLLPLFRELFRASALMVSLTVSAPVLAVALTAPLQGLVADRLGRKRVIVGAITGLSVPTFLAASAATLGQLIFWRFLQGLFIPGIIAVVIAYISEESPRQAVGSTMAIYVTGTVVGGFAGRMIVGLVAAHWNWRIGFVALGAVALAGALSTLWLLPQETKFVPRRASFSLKPLFAHLRNPQLLATYAVGFNILFSLVGAFTYVNFYLADKPFSLGPAALGQIFSVYLIGAVVTPVAGRLLDRIGYRMTLLGAVLVGAAGMLLTLMHALPEIIAGLALAATGVFVCQAAASSNVGKAASEARSSAAGLYVALYYLGGFAGSIIPGFFWKKAGWAACVAVILCVQSISALIAYRLWKD